MPIVRAPGSSANLGPGFDVLGAAISRHAWVSDDGPVPDRANNTGEPCAPDHIATIAHRAAGGSGPLWFAFDLQPGRGMGFSGAARAAAATLAGHQQGLDSEAARDRAYAVVAELEGHGDNAAPSVFGGIHVVAGAHHHRVAKQLPAELLLWVPDTKSSTDESRAILSAEVPRADAIHNIGHTALLVAALYEGNAVLFARAADDRLHQPIRFAKLAESRDAAALARAVGAYAAWLSGSGPSIGILTAPDRIGAITEALELTGTVEHLSVDVDGAIVLP